MVISDETVYCFQCAQKVYLVTLYSNKSPLGDATTLY